MNELDFLKALGEDRFPAKEASDFFSEMRKEAGTAKVIAQKGAEFLSKNKVQLLGSAIGAAAATGLQYMANKKGKDGPSSQRSSAEKNLAKSTENQDSMQAAGKEPGMLSELGHSRSKATADVSKVLEKHPKRGALLAAPVGAAVGGGLASLGKHLLR